MPRVKTLVSVQSNIEPAKLQQLEKERPCSKQPDRTYPTWSSRILKGTIDKLIRHAIVKELPHCQCRFEVSLFICDDKQITELNTAYLERAYPTDVLSFPQLPEDELERLKQPHKCDAHRAIQLGDIVVSIDAILRQAKRYRQSPIDELMRLVIHGLLHLLGYDDTTSIGRKAMTKRELTLIRSWRLREFGKAV
ncbi:MAG: rRNA maturation RNase YbeY [Armatimonadota bacterium]|nr:rRNA maturation RNase YbeY [Armatimonadota bacterium]MCX7778496.1 rRNA maturation RNase YbeY [Armatimonadota bacterium]MDW8025622.1 rRNA maturation RNase YbeY [Armatimonadota bacterium]